MLEEPLASHFLSQVGEAVGPLVQVGLVNLEDIAGEDHLGAFPGAGDDGFYLVRGEVLGLIHNEIHLPQGAAADIGQGRNQKAFILEHGLNLEGLLAAGLETAFNHVQVVHERLHVRAHLALLVTGQKADVLATQHHGGPAQNNLVVVLCLLQRGRQGQQRFACAGAAGERYQRNGRVQAGVQRKLLFVVAGPDAIGRMRPHQGNHAPGSVVPAANGFPAQGKLVQLVGSGFLGGYLLPRQAVVLPVGQALHRL